MAQGLPPPLLLVPHEVLDDILSALDQHPDLLSLALTCRHLASSVIPYHTDYRILRIRTLHPAIFAHLARRRDLTRNVREVHICERHNYTSADRIPRQLVDKDLDLDSATNGTNDERVRVWNVVRSLRYMWDLRVFTWSWNFPAGTTPQAQGQDSSGTSVGGMGGGPGRVGGPVRPTSDHRYEEAILAEVVRKPTLRHFGLSGGFGLHVPTLPLDKGYGYPVWHLGNLTSLCLLGDAWLKSCNALPLCLMLAKSPNLEYLEIPLEFKHLHTLRFPSLKKVKLHLQSGATASVDSSSARFLENNPTIEDLSWYPIGVPIFQPHAGSRALEDEHGMERGDQAKGEKRGTQLVLPNLKCLKTNMQGLEAFENEWELKRQLVESQDEPGDGMSTQTRSNPMEKAAEKLPKIAEEDEAEHDTEDGEDDAEGGYATYPSPSSSFSQNPNRVSTGSMNWASYLSAPSTPMSPSWPWPADPASPAISPGSTFSQAQNTPYGQIQQDLDFSRSYYGSASPPASPFGSTFGPPTTPTATWATSSFSTFASFSYPSGGSFLPSSVPSASTSTSILPVPSLNRLRRRRLTCLDVSGLTPSHLLSLPFLSPSSLKRVSIHRFSTHADVERLVDVAEKFGGLEWAAFPASVRHAGSTPSSRSSSEGGNSQESDGAVDENSAKSVEAQNGEWWSSGTSPTPPQSRSYISLETLLRILPLFKNLRFLRGRALWSAVMNDGDGPDAAPSSSQRSRDGRAISSRSERHSRRDHPTEYHKMKMHQILGELIKLCPRLEEVDHCDWYEKRWAWKRVVVLRRGALVEDQGRKGQITNVDKGKKKEIASQQVEVIGYEVRKPFMRDCFDVLDGAFN